MTQRKADLGLVLLTVIWGTTFTIVHESVRVFPPLAFIALRFSVAAAVFLPVLWARRAELRANLRPGLILGGLLFGGFATQTLGLQRTTPARAAFITGLSIVLVPLIALAWGQRPPRRALLGVALAVVGLGLVCFGCRIPWLGCLALEEHAEPQRLVGDAFVLACAVVYAFHIVGVSHWTARLSPLALNGIQLQVVAVAAALAALLTERPIPAVPLRVASAALFLGIVATAAVLTLWLSLQRYTTATHAGLIFALEPVFAAFFSWLWTGEALTAAIWSGGALMITGVVLAEVPLGPKLESLPFLRWLVDDPVAR
jgi:drug/metabolite transporter (DMT)-like permease